jgi:hypothetical protein
MIRLGMIATLALGGCAPTPAAETPATLPSGVECDATSIQDLVGKPLGKDTVADARRRSGAASARVLTPDMAVTMEFRADRLNVQVDAKNVVTRVGCG